MLTQSLSVEMYTRWRGWPSFEKTNAGISACAWTLPSSDTYWAEIVLSGFATPVVGVWTPAGDRYPCTWLHGPYDARGSPFAVSPWTSRLARTRHRTSCGGVRSV